MKRAKAVAIATACGIGLLLSANSYAANSFSNSLTGFTGDSTLAGTQSDLLTAGFTVASTAADPAVVFGPTGMTFGVFTAGDGGRNYVRTTQSDLATVSFVAEITFEASNIADQDIFFGLGTGDVALFGWPDWSTLVASTLVLPELDGSLAPKLTTFRTENDMNAFVNNDAPGLGNGTHRLRMALDASAKSVGYSIDLNYAGGPFVADVTAASVDLSSLYVVDGWPSDPSRIYFGGDDGVIFRDLSVAVVPEPASIGLLLAALSFAALGTRRSK
jgi:hypothetical protein